MTAPVLGFEVPEAAPSGVHVPDRIVLGDVEAAHGRLLVRQRIQLDRHCLRIDPGDAVAAVAGDPRHALRIQLDAVGLRLRPRHGHQLDIAGRRVQPAQHVAVLQREPERAVAVEDRRVRVLRRRVGHLVDGHLAGLRIELADRAVAVAGVPDVAGRIEGHRMRQRLRRQRIFLHLAGSGVDPPNQVAELPGPPDRAVRRLDRIARALAQRRHLPFLEGDRRRDPV